MSLWLYCHFPQLLMDTLRRIHPVADDYPLILYQSVTTSNDRIKEQVLQCNKKARAAGVAVGQSQVLAQSLAADLICRAYDPDKESQALRKIADSLYKTIDKQVLFPPQGIAIATDSLVRLYQGIEPLICHLKEQFQAFELNASLSVGHTPAAARCLAEANCEQLSADSNDIHLALGTLSIQQLGWPIKRVEKLYKSGVKTLDDLWLLPVTQIGKRFGESVVADLMALRSPQDRTPHKSSVEFYQPAETFFLSFDLVTEIEHWQGLLFPLKRALNELEHFLYQRQKVIRSLTITLYHREQQQTDIPLRLAVYNWRASQFLQLIQLQIDRYPLKQPVITLSLRADSLYDLDRDSGQLLTDAAQHQGDLNQLLARLQARLRNTAIYSPALNNDARPQMNEQRQAAGLFTTLPKRLLRRPLWLLSQPQSVDINRWQLIEGPERICSGWWDEQPFQRDYWIAKDSQQRTGWLFFQQQWFLQGWFS